MPVSARNTDKLLSFFFYIAVAAVIIWFGRYMTTHAGKTSLFDGYVKQWHVSLMATSECGFSWPYFSGTNHRLYMDEVVSKLKACGIIIPDSNTSAPYIRTHTPASGQKETLFILVQPGQVVIYGMSEETALSLDHLIDDQANPSGGAYTFNKTNQTYTGIWRQ